MATIKKNQLANIVFPMVDGTDFASVESGLTASDFESKVTKRYIGVTHGNSTAASTGTISKTATLVRSGIFQQTLKATETNYDYLVVSIEPNNTSLAHQILVFHPVDYDDSDLMSRISDVGSNLLSYLTGMSGALSDTYSLVSDVDSQLQLVATSAYLSDIQSNLLSYLTGMSGALSDVESQVDLLATSNYLSQVHSDLTSQIGDIGTGTVTASDISDIVSAVWAGSYSTLGVGASSFGSLLWTTISSRVSDIYSLLSDHHSDFQSRVTGAVATSNYLSTVHSDLRSQISGISAGSITASDISDIASAVWAAKYTAHSAASSFGSLMSDIDSQLAALADASDVGSAVWANAIGARVDSRILLIQSNVSDVESQLDLTASVVSDTYSLLSDHHSDFQSRVTGALATSNQLSAAESNLLSYLAGMSNTISTVYELVSDVDSALTLHDANMSNAVSDVRSYLVGMSGALSDVESQVDLLATSNYLSQVHSDLYSAIGGVTATLSASDISDIASAVWAADHSVLGAGASSFGSLVKTLATSNYLSQVESNLYSAVGNVSVALTASDISDIASAVADAITGVTPSDISNIVSAVWSEKYNVYSAVNSSFGSFFTQQTQGLSSINSDIYSAAQQINSRALVNQSTVNNTFALADDIDSALTSQFVWTSAFLSDMNSDLASKIGGVTAGISASDISDIASAVDALLASDLSDILSAAQQGNSRTLVIQSRVSDVESALDSQFAWTSNFLSDMNSDLSSQIGDISAGGVTVSNISDIASAVWADTIGARVDSRVVLIQSNISDIDSQLTITHSLLSDVESAVDALNDPTAAAIADAVWDEPYSDHLTASTVGSRLQKVVSDISDLDSALTVHDANISGMISDVDSQLTVTHSLVSDIESQLDLTASNVSDIESQLDVTHSLLSDVESAVDAIWTTALTESYNADGSAATAAQLLYGIFQNLTEFAINSTTITVKKLDGSTSAMTFTLDDDTNPTSRTRAT